MSDDHVTDHVQELRHALASQEEKNMRLAQALTTARQQLVHLQEQVRQVNQPPHQLGIFVGVDAHERHLTVNIQGRTMRVAAAPTLDMSTLSPGQLVRLDDKLIAVKADAFPRGGIVVTVRELHGVDRVLVSAENGAEHMLTLAGPLRHGNLRAGDSVTADVRAGFAFERVVRSDVEAMLTPEIPDVTYDDIGGLAEQIHQVRDAIELPFRHPELFRSYGLRPPKGILLYGPPGSGKTLIAQAVANSLSEKSSGQRTYFLSIKGPELLNKYVGETERHIRSIFSRARALASTDVPVVIFFDEMEALFRTRGTGISSDVETMIVPQLLAEMDGVEELTNVVIIGASNRADMIDPAVLRPGRLDVRIRVERPSRDGAADIFSKYLTVDMPLNDDEVRYAGSREAAVAAMIDQAVTRLFSRTPEAALFDATFASGRQQRIYVSDIVSGALIAGTVERAKKAAIKDALHGGPAGLSVAHLLSGVSQEMRESVELAASSSAEDWSRTIGLKDDIVAIRPIHDVTHAHPTGGAASPASEPDAVGTSARGEARP